MLSEGTITFNFNRAMQQARELDEIAANLSNLATSDFEGTLQNISMNWKGENARKYLIKGEINMSKKAYFYMNLQKELQALI